MKKAMTMEMTIVRMASDGTIDRIVRALMRDISREAREDIKGEIVLELLEPRNRRGVKGAISEGKIGAYIYKSVKTGLINPYSRIYKTITGYEKNKQTMLSEYLDRED